MFDHLKKMFAPVTFRGAGRIISPVQAFSAAFLIAIVPSVLPFTEQISQWMARGLNIAYAFRGPDDSGASATNVGRRESGHRHSLRLWR